MTNGICCDPECDKPTLCRGMCVTHYHRWNRASRSERPKPGICRGCGGEVPDAPGPPRHYCNPDCRPRCEIQGCDLPAHGRKYCTAHHTRWKRYGDPLAPKLREPNEGLCSIPGCPNPMRKKRLCAGHYATRRARRYRDGSRSMTAQQLADRDGALCGLCGCDVDMSARRPDLMAPSIDHIIPVSLGGSNHPGNLQLAHLLCNLSKGNRPVTSLLFDAVVP